MAEFLFSTVIISLSGVMAPGAMTAATLAHGTRHRHAGALITAGHAVVELPLIAFLLIGLATFLQNPAVKIAVGIAGGGFLCYMGYGMLKDMRNAEFKAGSMGSQKPLTAGIILSATNPYFLIWWATIGVKLALEAKEFSMLALVLFATLHLTCDLIWLEFLSHASYQGSKIMGDKLQKWVLGICGTALLFFGIKFLYDAATDLIG
ncbi:threonine efflux system [Anaerohalosphaera lusitana]|uniref:Threonine efflux system n=1 Tax=Anaerohalosphaera lusitana TaxID=1936003 RepID=A0A1U9NRM1_9BACT|nr:LysE family transporter [Anaerohalosphaera lusitana]AQT70176.1 threonine efflux system [Anaerohalosphaera lusitana]